MTIKDYYDLINDGQKLLDFINLKKTYLKNSGEKEVCIHALDIENFEDFIVKAIKIINDREVK